MVNKNNNLTIAVVEFLSIAVFFVSAVVLL